MKKTMFTLLILIAFSGYMSSLFAQQPSFKVLALNGNVYFAKSDKGPWDKVSLKTSLFEKDRVKIDNAGYLGLVHTSGRTAELKKTGVYKISDLSKKLAKTDVNISKRLTGFLLKEINQADNILSSKDYRQGMGTTGSTERGTERGAITTNDANTDLTAYQTSGTISLLSPRKTNIFYKDTRFTWAKSEGAKSYKFVLRDRFDKEIYSVVVNDSFLMLNVDGMNLERDVYYFWQVSVAEHPLLNSDECAFLILPLDKEKIINQDLKTLSNEVHSENSPMYNLLKAAYFEENNLFIDAGYYYQLAVVAAPDVPEYKKMYEVYLKKISGLY
jgi:hypothetical protein